MGWSQLVILVEAAVALELSVLGRGEEIDGVSGGPSPGGVVELAEDVGVKLPVASVRYPVNEHLGWLATFV